MTTTPSILDTRREKERAQASHGRRLRGRDNPQQQKPHGQENDQPQGQHIFHAVHDLFGKRDSGHVVRRGQGRLEPAPEDDVDGESATAAAPRRKQQQQPKSKKTKKRKNGDSDDGSDTDAETSES